MGSVVFFGVCVLGDFYFFSFFFIFFYVSACGKSKQLNFYSVWVNRWALFIFFHDFSHHSGFCSVYIIYIFLVFRCIQFLFNLFSTKCSDLATCQHLTPALPIELACEPPAPTRLPLWGELLSMANPPLSFTQQHLDDAWSSKEIQSFNSKQTFFSGFQIVSVLWKPREAARVPPGPSIASHQLSAKFYIKSL